MLELAVLGLLHESPMHGYQLRKQLHARLGTFRAFSWGSLYPTLRRLQRAGLIAETDEPPPDDTADEGEPAGSARSRPAARSSWGRRGRRTFELTAEGKDRFDELLGDAGPADLGRRELRRPPGLLLADAGRGADAHPRGPAPSRGGTP